MSSSFDETPQTTMVDVSFALLGHSLPRDCASTLAIALEQLMPWLSEEPLAGIHPLKLVPGTDTQALLSQRTRLLLRLPRERIDAAKALVGRSFQVGENTVTFGDAHVRELLAHRTLYAYAVAAELDDELAFMQAMHGELKSHQVRSQVICGKRQQRDTATGVLTTFSLMLHGLTPIDSLRLQELGLGHHRMLGCGIFVPHKSAAAVGE